MGMFAGGVSNTGDSSMVDLFDFDERRMLPRMDAPTVRYCAATKMQRLRVLSAATLARRGNELPALVALGSHVTWPVTTNCSITRCHSPMLRH